MVCQVSLASTSSKISFLSLPLELTACPFLYPQNSYSPPHQAMLQTIILIITHLKNPGNIVAACDPGSWLLAALQAGWMTAGFTLLYPIFTGGVITDANFTNATEDKYIKGCKLLSSINSSSEQPPKTGFQMILHPYKLSVARCCRAQWT